MVYQCVNSPPFLKGGKGGIIRPFNHEDVNFDSFAELSLLQNSEDALICHSERSEESCIFNNLISFTALTPAKNNFFLGVGAVLSGNLSLR
jgi:hypothetical protein